IQIRTHAMHEFAEYGMAAHWRYKESGPRGGQTTAGGSYDRKIAWMRQLLAFDGTSAESPDKQDKDASTEPPLVPERIYVMTPQARVIELPHGATPLDF